MSVVTIEVIVGTGRSIVWTFHTLVPFAVRLRALSVGCAANRAVLDVGIGTLYALAIVTVSLRTVCSRFTGLGWSLLCTLDTNVVDVTERLVLVLRLTSGRLLVGFWTFHTLVLFTERHTWDLGLAYRVELRRCRAVGALHTLVVFTGVAVTVGCVADLPLVRTLTACVIHAVLVIRIELLTCAERGEASRGTLATTVGSTVRTR